MKLLFVILLLIISGIFTGEGICHAQTKEKTEDSQPALVLTADANKIVLKDAPVGEVMEIYSIVGVNVETHRITKSDQIFYLKLSKGYYFVKIGDVVRKIAIK